MTAMIRAAQKLGLAAVILTAGGPAAADTVHLRNGSSVQGTVANQEVLLHNSATVATISINTAEGLQRYSSREVEYIVLNQPDGDKIIDLLALESTPPGNPTARLKKLGGGAMILLGTAMGIVAIAKPFGEEDGEDHHNGANALLGLGGVVFVFSGAYQFIVADGGASMAYTFEF